MNSYEKAKKFIIENGSLTPKEYYYPLKKTISDSFEIGRTYRVDEKKEPLVIDRTGSPHHIIDFYIPKSSKENKTNIFGGIYHSRPQLITINKVNEYVPFLFNSQLVNQNVFIEKNCITILESGIYELFYNILISANKKIDVMVAARKNETAINETRSRETLNKNEARITGTTLISLNTQDKIDLAIQVISNLPENLEIIVNDTINATLILKKIAS